jgi:hypothetical protein
MTGSFVAAGPAAACLEPVPAVDIATPIRMMPATSTDLTERSRDAIFPHA